MIYIDVRQLCHNVLDLFIYFFVTFLNSYSLSIGNLPMIFSGSKS